MEKLSLKNKKKFTFPVIGGVILILLVGGVSYAFSFINTVLRGTVGDLQGTSAPEVKFELQKARNLGITDGQ